MWFRLAALAVLAMSPCAFAWAQSPPVMSLDDAFARVAQSHPQIRLFDARGQVLAAEKDQASQRPPWMAAVDVENAFGTGPYSGLSGADVTLSLASVFERGGKLDARRALAQSRIDGLSVDREMQRLDLLAETARRYLAVVAAQQMQRIAEEDIQQRKRAVSAAQARLQAGASPASVVMTAQAALARAELDRDRAVQQATAARQYLAALWGERQPQFQVADLALLALPQVADFDALTGYLQATPELARFASQQRVGEARLQLARSEAKADWQWQAGIRGVQGRSDTALVAGLVVPLGTASRAQPGIRAAEASLAELQIAREAGELGLYSTLVEAHGRYQLARLELARMQSDVLPAWARAAKTGEATYRAGAASYLEWSQLQSEWTQARRQQLATAVDAYNALIEIQRLTGQPMLADVQGGNP